MNQEDQNHLTIEEILESLKEKLGPLINDIFAPAMKSETGSDEMRAAADKIRLGRPLDELDSYAYLRLLIEVSTVRRNLNELGLCHAHEMIVIRNLWEDDYKFSDSEVERARDTAERLQGYLEHYFDEPPVRDDAVQKAAQQLDPDPPALTSSQDARFDDYRERGMGETQSPFRSPPPARGYREHHEHHRRKPEAPVPDLFEPGQILKGEIAGITNHGLMLNLNVSRHYLVHKKNLGGIFIRDRSVLSDLYELGEIIEVKVLSVDELGRPSLAPVEPRMPQGGGPDPMRPRAPRSDHHNNNYQSNGHDGWHRHSAPDADASMPKTGDVVRGTIRGIYPRGASVSLDSGWGGYLHISNISREFVRNVGDYVAVGQDLDLIVLGVDSVKRRIDLGLKQLQK
jgi:predicted RNA-binding protein with RPS1 domain